MTYWLPLFRMIVAALIALLMPHTVTTAPAKVEPKTTQPATQVVWSDEFDGQSGASPDAGKWEPRPTDQWTNGLQDYVNGPSNAYLDGNGSLVLAAIKGDSGGRPYSSARFRSRKPFLYGLFEARIWMPAGIGTAPAFWMIGDDAHLSWPGCGEIDTLEAPAIAGQARQVHAGTHNPKVGGGELPVGVPPVPASDGWHTYAVDWRPDSLEWFVDGHSIGKVTRATVEGAGGVWVYNTNPEVISLNLGVGGWAGTPDNWSVQTMLIDYVRISQ